MVGLVKQGYERRMGSEQFNLNSVSLAVKAMHDESI
jgi:hypothetical protein